MGVSLNKPPFQGRITVSGLDWTADGTLSNMTSVEKKNVKQRRTMTNTILAEMRTAHVRERNYDIETLAQIKYLDCNSFAILSFLIHFV